MRSSLTALCRDFEEKREVMRKIFRWESPYIYPVCGAAVICIAAASSVSS